MTRETWRFTSATVNKRLQASRRSRNEGKGWCLSPTGGNETLITRPRLLLIDDEPQLAAFVASAARMSGFEPLATNCDSDFRKAFDDQQPAMVVLDLGMPGMDGVELLRFLAERGFEEPVLIISGFDRRVLESAFRLGEELGLKMRGPIEKPARLDELEAVLKDNLPSVSPGTRGP